MSEKASFPTTEMKMNEETTADRNIVVAFSNLANRYERSTAGAHHEIARKLMCMSPPFTSESTILDNATGTGIVIEEIQKHISSSNTKSDMKIQVFAADAAKSMIDYLDIKIEQKEATNAWPNLHPLRTYNVPAEQLDSSVIPDNSITHAYMNFGLFFCSDPVLAASHIYRSLEPGGTALITAWRDSMHMNPIRHTLSVLYPDKPPLKMPYSDLWEEPEYIRDVLVTAGFTREKIEIVQEDTYQRFKDVLEMAEIKTELFTTLVKGREGWASADAKSEFTKTLAKNLLSFDRFYDDGERGVSLKMVANVAICKK